MFNVVSLADSASDEIGAVFDPFGKVGLVTGAGPIGIITVAVARKAGARTVILTDIND
jgi:threonine 3-dehydrogenase